MQRTNARRATILEASTDADRRTGYALVPAATRLALVDDLRRLGRGGGAVDLAERKAIDAIARETTMRQRRAKRRAEAEAAVAG